MKIDCYENIMFVLKQKNRPGSYEPGDYYFKLSQKNYIPSILTFSMNQLSTQAVFGGRKYCIMIEEISGTGRDIVLVPPQHIIRWVQHRAFMMQFPLKRIRRPFDDLHGDMEV